MASEVSVSPPVYGSRQLHQTLDYVAATTPDRVYATIPQSSNLDDGFVDISFDDMKQCSDAAAHWIEDNFGRSSTFESLCCIGIPDLRTVAMFFGAVKCGYKVITLLRNKLVSDTNGLKRSSFPHPGTRPRRTQPC